MNFKTKVLAALQSAVTKNFTTSAEGSTGNGIHEVLVSEHFKEEGFPVMEKYVTHVVTSKRKSKKGEEEKPEKTKKILVMDKTTHSPSKEISIPFENGTYQIAQPYQFNRGSFNPAPDMYLVSVEDNKIVEWIGVECKSSKSFTPTWNDNLPRQFIQGNIIYLFTGACHTCVFTHDVFFNGKESKKIKDVYEKTRLFLEEEWKKQNCHEEFPFLKADFRIKCEQNKQITAEMMVSYNEQTFEFLRGVEKFTF